MAERSSSKSEISVAFFHGYSLVIQPGNHGWTSLVFDSDSKSVLTADRSQPWPTREEAQTDAEKALRKHCEASGEQIPSDDKPKWKARAHGA